MKAPIDSGTVRSIAIADELTEAYQADTELVDIIRKVRTEKLTNIGRYFSGVTLTRMQLQIKQSTGGDGSQTLWAKHTSDQLHNYFRWVFQFLQENSVDVFKNDAMRSTLLNDHARVLPSAAESMPDHQRLVDHPYSSALPDEPADEAPFDDATDEDTPNETSEPSSIADSGKVDPGDDEDDTGDAHSGGPGRKRDKKPERSLYSGVKLPNLSTNIQRLLKEAKQLSIDENYATACVLARVILELAVSDPKVLRWSGKKEGDKLAEKIRGCIVKLEPLIDSTKRTRQDLVQANFETNEIGVTYLHQFMHNPSAKADPHLSRRFSAAYTPLLNGINEAVK